MPPDYVANQRYVNLRHNSGEFENDSDWSTAEAVEELAAQVGARSVLSVGCRTGYELLNLAEDGIDTCGVDLIPELLVVAHGRNIPVALADMHRLPFRAASFDLTVCIGTLEHAYAPAEAASELLRVTRRHLFVTGDLDDRPGHNRSHYVHTTDPEDWLRLFRRPGWSLTHTVEGPSVRMTVTREE